MIRVELVAAAKSASARRSPFLRQSSPRVLKISASVGSSRSAVS